MAPLTRFCRTRERFENGAGRLQYVLGCAWGDAGPQEFGEVPDQLDPGRVVVLLGR